MLTDPGQVDCPLLEKLGYPVMLVHTRHGTKCIPQVQVFPASSNPHNNRQATVAAARLSTGLAMGCVVGEVYALRRDTKSLTGPEWEILRDALDQLMNDYGVGPGYVDEALLRRYRRDTRERMRGLSDTPPDHRQGRAGPRAAARPAGGQPPPGSHGLSHAARGAPAVCVQQAPGWAGAHLPPLQDQVQAAGPARGRRPRVH